MIELSANLTRSTKVLLVMDVVESVRIMEQDQDGFVRRWQELVKKSGIRCGSNNNNNNNFPQSISNGEVESEASELDSLKQ